MGIKLNTLESIAGHITITLKGTPIRFSFLELLSPKEICCWLKTAEHAIMYYLSRDC